MVRRAVPRFVRSLTSEPTTRCAPIGADHTTFVTVIEDVQKDPIDSFFQAIEEQDQTA